MDNYLTRIAQEYCDRPVSLTAIEKNDLWECCEKNVHFLVETASGKIMMGKYERLRRRQNHPHWLEISDATRINNGARKSTYQTIDLSTVKQIYTIR